MFIPRNSGNGDVIVSDGVNTIGDHICAEFSWTYVFGRSFNEFQEPMTFADRRKGPTKPSTTVTAIEDGLKRISRCPSRCYIDLPPVERLPAHYQRALFSMSTLSVSELTRKQSIVTHVVFDIIVNSRPISFFIYAILHVRWPNDYSPSLDIIKAQIYFDHTFIIAI